MLHPSSPTELVLTLTLAGPARRKKGSQDWEGEEGWGKSGAGEKLSSLDLKSSIHVSIDELIHEQFTISFDRFFQDIVNLRSSMKVHFRSRSPIRMGVSNAIATGYSACRCLRGLEKACRTTVDVC